MPTVFVRAIKMPTDLNPQVRKHFDYSELKPTDSEFVQQQTEKIRVLMRQTAQGILEMGQRLLSIKERLGHGHFGNWLAAEFPGTERTAQLAMNVAEAFKSENFSDLTFDISALYELAAPSTPQAARDEALARAEAGEPISYSTAKAIRKKYTPTRSKRKAPEPENLTLVQTQQSEQTKQPVQLGAIAPSTVLPQIQSQAVENRAAKQILAVLPKKVEPEPISVQEPKFATPIKPLSKSSPLQSGSWWDVEGRHLFFCGSPNSPMFQGRLPSQVALQIAFPPSSDYWSSSISPKIRAALVLLSLKIGVNRLREMVEFSIEDNTESEDYIVFAFLPDPELLVIAHEMDCRCLIAEPDLAKCQAAIALWQSKGMKIDRVKTLRF